MIMKMKIKFELYISKNFLSHSNTDFYRPKE